MNMDGWVMVVVVCASSLVAHPPIPLSLNTQR